MQVSPVRRNKDSALSRGEVSVKCPTCEARVLEDGLQRRKGSLRGLTFGLFSLPVLCHVVRYKKQSNSSQEKNLVCDRMGCVRAASDLVKMLMIH